MMVNDGWHETTIRVRYKDTDRLGVVYYGNYLTFFEVGRAEFMRDLGFPYSKIESDGYSLVVTEAAAKYHDNVGYDALVTVRTRIADLRRVRIRFDYQVVSDGRHLLVSGYTVHACMDSNKKLTRIPPDVREVIEKNLVKSSEAPSQADPSSVAGYCGGRARLSPGMAIPLPPGRRPYGPEARRYL
jgi:acyl-CoA thioester hydrolase